jgi:hypothetical protein
LKTISHRRSLSERIVKLSVWIASQRSRRSGNDGLILSFDATGLVGEVRAAFRKAIKRSVIEWTATSTSLQISSHPRCTSFASQRTMLQKYCFDRDSIGLGRDRAYENLPILPRGNPRRSHQVQVLSILVFAAADGGWTCHSDPGAGLAPDRVHSRSGLNQIRDVCGRRSAKTGTAQ